MRPLMLLVFAACLVLLPHCATTEKAFKGISSSTTHVREAGTAVMDARCLEVAKACPKGKADDCKLWVTCSGQRASFYASTNTLQLMCASGLSLLASGLDTQAKLLLVQAGLAVNELYERLKALGVFETAGSSAPAPAGAGGGR